MGIRFARDYREILTDLAQALDGVDCHELLEMSEADWARLEVEERTGCIRTLADDVFYALGSEPLVHIGAGRISHDKAHHVIKVCSEDNVIRLVYLV